IAAGNVNDLQESLALSHLTQNIDVYNNSWGPPDNGALYAPGPLATAALQQGATAGRSGLGVVYVWAGGNGRGSLDNVNYDLYASSRFTIAVGSIQDNGQQASYSEPGASLFIVTPGS